MQFLTTGRKFFIALNLLIFLTSYFTYRTIVRKFFFEIRNELKWIISVVCGLTLFSYWMVSFVSPGKVRKLPIPNPAEIGVSDPVLIKQLKEECDRCGKWRPPRARHCEICRMCVFRQDSHNEVLNTCIGVGNFKLVTLFGFLSLILGLIILSIDITAFFLWTQGLKKSILEVGLRLTFVKIVSGSVFLTGLIILFIGINYTYFMILIVKDNQTTYEFEHGNLYGRPSDFESNFEQLFGKWGWWLPLPASTQTNYLEVLYTKEYIQKNSRFIEDMFDQPSSQYFKEYQKYKC